MYIHRLRWRSSAELGPSFAKDPSCHLRAHVGEREYTGAHGRRAFASCLVAASLTGPALALADPGAGSRSVTDPAGGSALTSSPTDELAPDATAGAPAPRSSQPVEDVDLAALGLEPGAPSFDDQLNVFGFAAFSFTSDHWSRPVPTITQDSQTFAIANLNMYLAKNLTTRTRTLAEIRFTFLPNASQNILDGSIVGTTATDVTDYSRQVQWGGVIIERAYVEYDLLEHLTIRGGHWLTPYGIWNIDHGAPAIIPTRRPYIVGAQFFPEHQTGLDAFGGVAGGGFKLSYHLTASNGRGGAEAQADQDGELAFGARLEVESTWGLRIGGSYYRGRYTALPRMIGVPADTYLEAAYGGDILFERGGLRLQGEVIARDVHYPGQGLPTPAGLVTDSHDFGFYGIAGYRFDWLVNAMPFLYYEDYRPGDHSLFTHVYGEAAGLNFRPTPTLVVKAMGSLISISGMGLLGDVNLREFTGEVSWVF